MFLCPSVDTELGLFFFGILRGIEQFSFFLKKLECKSFDREPARTSKTMELAQAKHLLPLPCKTQRRERTTDGMRLRLSGTVIISKTAKTTANANVAPPPPPPAQYDEGTFTIFSAPKPMTDPHIAMIQPTRLLFPAGGEEQGGGPDQRHPQLGRPAAPTPHPDLWPGGRCAGHGVLCC